MGQILGDSPTPLLSRDMGDIAIIGVTHYIHHSGYIDEFAAVHVGNAGLCGEVYWDVFLFEVGGCVVLGKVVIQIPPGNDDGVIHHIDCVVFFVSAGCAQKATPERTSHARASLAQSLPPCAFRPPVVVAKAARRLRCRGGGRLEEENAMVRVVDATRCAAAWCPLVALSVYNLLCSTWLLPHRIFH